MKNGEWKCLDRNLLDCPFQLDRKFILIEQVTRSQCFNVHWFCLYDQLRVSIGWSDVGVKEFLSDLKAYKSLL